MWRVGSVVVAHGLCRSAACGIFPDQGWNPCSLHWQADSEPLRHQGSPFFFWSLYSFPILFLEVEINKGFQIRNKSNTEHPSMCPFLGYLLALRLSLTCSSSCTLVTCWSSNFINCGTFFLIYFITDCRPHYNVRMCLALVSIGQTGLQDDRGRGLWVLRPHPSSQHVRYPAGFAKLTQYVHIRGSTVYG